MGYSYIYCNKLTFCIYCNPKEYVKCKICKDGKMAFTKNIPSTPFKRLFLLCTGESVAVMLLVVFFYFLTYLNGYIGAADYFSLCIAYLDNGMVY